MSGEALKSLFVHNLRGCIEPFRMDFEKKKKLTIIYGENGSGKSTICDAFELIGRGKVGSLDGRGLNKTQSYWSTLGRSKSEIAVKLETNGDKYGASLDKSTVIWNPTNTQPTVEILRRSQILKLVEAAPAARYNEISRFINVSGVEASEASLKTLLDTVKRNRESQVDKLQGSKDILDRLFKAAGVAGEDPVAWARQEAERDFTEQERELRMLIDVEGSFLRLSAHKGTWGSTQKKLNEAKVKLKESQVNVVASLTGISEDAGDVIDILLAAKPFLSKTPEPSSCPLCEGKEKVSGLGDRVAARIVSFQSLKTAKDNLAAANKAMEIAALEPDRLKGIYAKDRDAFQASLKREWSEEVPLPTADCPADLSEFDTWLEANKELVERWKALASKRSEQKNASANIKDALEVYDENLELPATVEELIPRLKKALELVREERRKFTDGILSKIADEVGRLYEIAHTGEGLQKISLQLDVKRRASLDLGAEFCGKAGVPPQAYFSDSHLDTLGLCVFLALAKMENPSDTILVIDDVLASVDEPHVERLIEMICEEAKSFRHCIITTHYRPWREKYRWGWLKNGRCQFIELGKWSENSGISQTRSVPEVERLEKLLGEDSPDLQAICSKSGVILEATLDFLTLLYHCNVPRRSYGRYTLGDLLPNIKKRTLRKALRVEVLTKSGEAGPEYEIHPLGEILDELERIAQARNVFGAHFNELSFELLDSEAIEFSTKVLELSKLLTDEENGWPRNRKSGSYWATAGETRRLHPLEHPR
jgi:energy-coupling factor transporter ATP-binding protein EcfA2